MNPAGRFLSLAALLLLTVASPAPSAQTNASEPIIIGVVVVTEIPLDAESSGSVVDDPKAYQDIPGVRVITMAVPPQSFGVPFVDDVFIGVNGGARRPAGEPFVFRPAASGQPLRVDILRRDDPLKPITTATIPIEPPASSFLPNDPAPKPIVILDDRIASGMSMPPVAVAGSVQVIEGAKNGNAATMAIRVDEMPARIIAAKPGAVYWRVPAMIAPGPHQVSFTPAAGVRPVILALHVIGLGMSADNTNMLRGQSTRMHVTVGGLETLPASTWKAALPFAGLLDLKQLALRAPGFKPPKLSDDGVVLLILENRSPSVIRMGGKGDRIALTLRQRDFSNGPYRYEDKLQSLQSGAFDIRGSVTPFLKPSVGRAAD